MDLASARRSLSQRIERFQWRTLAPFSAISVPNPPPRLVLASGSLGRQELLKSRSIDAMVVTPNVDEGSAQRRAKDPSSLAAELALLKACTVATEMPTHAVIGADQVPWVNGQMLVKPGRYAETMDQLSLLSGRTHELHTSVCVIVGEFAWRYTDITRLTMRRLEHEEIERYVDHETPYEMAGGYKLEGRGIFLFDQIETEDYTSIVGLPMMALGVILREVGVHLP